MSVDETATFLRVSVFSNDERKIDNFRFFGLR